MDSLAKSIDTDHFSEKLRARLTDSKGTVLISSFDGSEQSADLSEAPNCGGLGRIRHFHRASSAGWPRNPLPIDPAARALGLGTTDILTAEIFQLAGCNWRCWYCYVPFNRLAADEKTSKRVTPSELVRLYADLPQRPSTLVLSGGQPDLVPEWIPRTMRSMVESGLDDKTYLWSDDNLSNFYFWKYLSGPDIATMRGYRNYGRVCCFKGFDSYSFAFNTKADPALYDRQFEIFARMLDVGIDMYGYVTLTSDQADDVELRLHTFVDKLQAISRLLPLRIIPLEILAFTPVRRRATGERIAIADEVQQRAVAAWNFELEARFTSAERGINIVDVAL